MDLIQFGLQLEDELNIWDVIDYKLHIESWYIPNTKPHQYEWSIGLLWDSYILPEEFHLIWEMELCN